MVGYFYLFDMQSSKAFNKKYLKKLPLRLILLLGLFASAIFLFVIIIHEVLWEDEVRIDNSIFKYLSANIINTRFTTIMRVVTHFASAIFLQLAYGAIVILYLILKNWKRAMEVAAIGIGGFIINYVMKLSFRRMRPPDPLIEKLNNFSFPSGHATSAFIFYGLLAYLIWKTNMSRIYKVISGSILILFSLVIGFSRVYLRVHFTSDVVAGFCIGFAWLTLSIWVMERLKKKSDSEMHNSPG